MDVPPDLLSPPLAPTDAPAAAFLVVHNGRQRGTRRPLASPLTILGRASSCDLRLNADGVAELHCALAFGPTGLVVRDLGSPGTLVNGQPVTSGLLAHADLLTVGPFQFTVDLVAPLPPDEERAALRIQAAAVAAQQAALTDEEQRLQQRQTALENQEQQLAAHLEQRRQRLVEAQEQFRAEKANWRQECAAAAEAQAAVEVRLRERRSEADQEYALARDRRFRVDQLRRRLIQRFRQDWSAKEAELARRERDLEAGQARLARESAGLQKQRAALHDARLRHNGDVELGRRQLQDQWEELGLAQQRWEQCLEQEQQALARRLEETRTAVADVTSAAQARAAEAEAATKTRDTLLAECAGLEMRIRNGRQQLQEQERTLASLSAAGRAQGAATPLTLSPPAGLPTPLLGPLPEVGDLPATLTRVSDQLADQRAHLIEQWHHLLACHDAFHQERTAALVDTEAIAQRLVEREQGLHPQEQALEAERLRLVERQESLGRLRNSLEAWQSRLTIQRTETEAEAVALHRQAQAHREATDTLLHRQKRLRHRLVRRWRTEVEALRTARLRVDESRRQYLALLEELHAQQTEVADRQRQQAAETVALEQLRLEILGRPATPAAEKRLEQLRRQAKALNDSAAADRDRRARALAVETTRLEERAQALQRAEERLLGRQQKGAQQHSLWEATREQVAATEDQLRCELQQLQAQHEADERRLASLRDEVERLASVLLDEAGPERPAQAAPATQAA